MGTVLLETIIGRDYTLIQSIVLCDAVVVCATANLGDAVVVEAALSFLGVGTPPDVPSWGGMLSIAGQKYIEVSPWLVLFPSLAVSIAVFGFNLLGDALRDALDPRLRGWQER